MRFAISDSEETGHLSASVSMGGLESASGEYRGRTMDITWSETFCKELWEDDGSRDALVRRVVLNAMAHEVDEWLRVDGRLVRDPHPEGADNISNERHSFEELLVLVHGMEAARDAWKKRAEKAERELSSARQKSARRRGVLASEAAE